MNYQIVAPRGLPHAVLCEQVLVQGNDLPPPEEFPTLEDAIARLPALFADIAKLCFHPQMPIPANSLSVQIVLLDSILDGRPKPISADGILKQFRRHPSVPVAGMIYFWESHYATAICMVQGKREIEAYLGSEAGQEVQQLVESIGASAIDVAGVRVKRKKR